MSLFRLATYQVPKSLMWLVAAHLDGSVHTQGALQLPLTLLYQGQR